MKSMPMIEKYMTAMPHTINPEVSIKAAMDLMRTHHVRHFPVQRAGELVGVLTDRDIKLAASFTGADALTVEDVMTPDPFVASPETPVDKIAIEMAEHKYGCAVIRQTNGRVVGIFTATDGLRVLSEILRGNYKPVEH